MGFVRVCVSLQERECLGFVVWLSKFCNLLQMCLFTMYLGTEVRVGRSLDLCMARCGVCAGVCGYECVCYWDLCVWG